MTAVRLEDLPAAVRARVLAAGRPLARPSTSSPAKVRTVARGSSTWRCHGCGMTTTVWAEVERHTDMPGHGWIELLFDVMADTEPDTPDPEPDDADD